MQRVVMLMVMFANAAFALEYGTEQCIGGIDDDADGLIDSAECLYRFQTL